MIIRSLIFHSLRSRHKHSYPRNLPSSIKKFTFPCLTPLENNIGGPWQPYHYGANNPFLYLDPSGLNPEAWATIWHVIFGNPDSNLTQGTPNGHNYEDPKNAAARHGVRSILDIQGGNEMESTITYKLKFNEYTNIESKAEAIFKDLKQFNHFNQGGFHVKLKQVTDHKVYANKGGKGLEAHFHKDGMEVLPSRVEITYYDKNKLMVADTMDPHFLVGTRKFGVRVTGNNSLEVYTWARDHTNGFANAVMGAGMGLRKEGADGEQNSIWTEFFTNIISAHSNGLESRSAPDIKHKEIKRGFQLPDAFSGAVEMISSPEIQDSKMKSDLQW